VKNIKIGLRTFAKFIVKIKVVHVFDTQCRNVSILFTN